MFSRSPYLGLLAGSLMVGACAPSSKEPVELGPKEYVSIDTRLLEGELVNFQVAMRNAESDLDVRDYMDCAAAQYTLIRGKGFVQRVTTKVTQEDGLWNGDGVYTLSDAVPGGRFTIDAEVVADNCRENNIPMV